MSSFATPPNKILIIRHAEEPSAAGDIHLAPQGIVKAQRLATYILATLGRPEFLFATRESGKSNRSSRWRKVSDPLFADRDYGALAEEIFTNPKYHGALVLICWQHEEIPKLALALGAPPNSVRQINRILWPPSSLLSTKPIGEVLNE